MAKSRNSSGQRYGKRHVGLTGAQEARLRIRLRREAPSEPWVDAQIVDVTQTDPRGKEVAYRVFNSQVFPPGGQQTLMRPCTLCGVLTPPETIEGGECLDHSEHLGWGPSPSAVAIREAQRLCLRMRFTELQSESTETLRLEIRKARNRAARANHTPRPRHKPRGGSPGRPRRGAQEGGIAPVGNA